MQQYLRFILQSWPLLAFGFITIFWGNFGQSFFLSWYGTPIQESLGISASYYGSLYAIATLGSGFLIMAFGGLIDRLPLRIFAAGAATGLALGCVLIGLSIHAMVLLAGLFLVRMCGQGLLPHTAQTTMARYFDSDRGKALSLSSSGVPFGEAILPLVIVGLIAWLGWRESWLVIMASTLLLYLPLMAWLLRQTTINTETPPASASAKILAKSAGRREMLTDRRFWLALPVVLSGPYMVTAIFIHQGFIITQKDWTPAWLATCFVAYGITHWVMSLIAGVLIDRFSAQALLRVMALPLIGALVLVAHVEGTWVALPFMMLLATTIGIASPLNGALWAEVYGTAKLGSIRSLMTSLMIISTAISPAVLGIFIDQGHSITQIFSYTAWLLVGAVVLVQFSYRPGQASPA